MTSSRIQAELRAAGALRREALNRMALEKNREKGPWSRHTVRELLAMARAELDEVETALDAGEGSERVVEEIGDAGAFLAFMLDVVKRGGA